MVNKALVMEIDSVTLFQWANEYSHEGLSQMPTVAEMESAGYHKVARHHLYPTSWLMKKELTYDEALLLLVKQEPKEDKS